MPIFLSLRNLIHLMKKFFILSMMLCLSSLVLAKLPALSDEGKAKAAEAAAKAAWSGKIDGYALCKSQDKVAAHQVKFAGVSGKELKSSPSTPPCADPGPFVYNAAAAPVGAASAAKPLEAAGAHSPTPTAASPPSTKLTDATVNPVKKP